MYIAFNTDELTAEDRKVLALLAGTGDWPSTPLAAGETVVATPKPAPAKKAAPAKAAPAKATVQPEQNPAEAAEEAPAEEAPAEEPPAEPEEDLLGGAAEAPAEGPTMEDAVAAATKLVSSGGASKVKAALATLGVKRVSELQADQVADFLAALDA